ncbi:hypothetical protein PC119_g17627 [Phytophthora cactorum]|uniref:protein-L-isoaspartate(D-aspartate) O-methyltransferase n=1 Tax=Phytophthora cactorum TaxID=29920 RepID=A0A8T1C7G7_9STRA|nr:hypothetical protein PC117_g17884 [Phytophthora cactorum]KAG2997646.1 hypothetical protein PC119_g17627 [Phytophthora cactorum]KAG3144335.1 hypothetical protein C6341_g18758 [Phytophthora cactorum]
MFWPSNSSSNEDLVKNLKRTGVVRSDAVFNAMAKTDRAKYLAQIETPDGGHVGELAAYQDVPHPIGYLQTISAPHMHGHAMELAYAAIKDVRHPRILDVGAGSGYLTACLGRMVEDNGHVFGLEIVPGLVQFAKKNIQTADGDLIDRGVVSVRCHNGWDGLPNEAPFHYIHVGAAAEAPPQALLDQLADGGRMVLPLDEARGGQVKHALLSGDRPVAWVPPTVAKLSTSNDGAVQDEAYQDSPCPIGFNQTISAPHMHAHILELAQVTCADVLKPRVLDVGAGSGYLTAALARLVEQDGGRVFGLELLPALAQSARKNVLNAAPDLIETGVLSLHCYNGWYGLPTEAPFHFIFVGAAVSSPPQALLDQLADGGQLVIPVDDPRGGQALKWRRVSIIDTGCVTLVPHYEA